MIFGMPEVKNRYSGVIIEPLSEDTRIKHNDYFHMKYVYMLSHEWLMENGWQNAGGKEFRNDPEFPEDMYLHRWDQKQGQELWIWWRLTKKINSFIRYDLDIDWHIVGMQDTEVMQNGVKYKANKGEVEFKIYAKVILDPKGEWQKSKLMKGMFELFYLRMYKPQIKNFRRDLYRELFKFKDAMKTYFNLKTYLPEPEGHRFWLDENFQTQK